MLKHCAVTARCCQLHSTPEKILHSCQQSTSCHFMLTTLCGVYLTVLHGFHLVRLKAYNRCLYLESQGSSCKCLLSHKLQSPQLVHGCSIRLPVLFFTIISGMPSGVLAVLSRSTDQDLVAVMIFPGALFDLTNGMEPDMISCVIQCCYPSHMLI